MFHSRQHPRVYRDEVTEGGACFAVSPDVLVEDFDSEIVVLDPRTGDMHLLEATSTLIWRALDEPVTAPMVASHVLAQVVGAPPVDVVTDAVRQHLVELQRLGLIVRVADG